MMIGFDYWLRKTSVNDLSLLDSGKNLYVQKIFMRYTERILRKNNQISHFSHLQRALYALLSCLPSRVDRQSLQGVINRNPLIFSQDNSRSGLTDYRADSNVQESVNSLDFAHQYGRRVIMNGESEVAFNCRSHRTDSARSFWTEEFRVVEISPIVNVPWEERRDNS